MITGDPDSFTIEFQTGNGDWRLAIPGRKWKTHSGAYNAMKKWAHAQLCDFSWNPPVRVIELHKSYNARGVPFLATA